LLSLQAAEEGHVREMETREARAVVAGFCDQYANKCGNRRLADLDSIR